ncbi:MAG: hypothetical protein U9Q03_03495 [Patescibacteria group bacterium]|nr:hypothetical protein [Patescibacteria group bacterium]
MNGYFAKGIAQIFPGACNLEEDWIERGVRFAVMSKALTTLEQLLRLKDVLGVELDTDIGVEIDWDWPIDPQERYIIFEAKNVRFPKA